MNKYLDIVLRIILSLIIVMPVVSLIAILFGADIQPKPEYYNTPEAYSFIRILMDSMYITVINAIVFALAFVFLWTKRVALAALILLPVTVNIIGFHAFLDGGLFTSGALMANILFILNLVYLWKERKSYVSLLMQSK